MAVVFFLLPLITFHNNPSLLINHHPFEHLTKRNFSLCLQNIFDHCYNSDLFQISSFFPVKKTRYCAYILCRVNSLFYKKGMLLPHEQNTLIFSFTYMYINFSVHTHATILRTAVFGKVYRTIFQKRRRLFFKTGEGSLCTFKMIIFENILKYIFTCIISVMK